MSDLQQHRHAALLASGLNLGPTRMAECCSLSYRQLAWATEWYLGDEQLEAVNAALVDYLHQLQLAAHWGTRTFSSSDGQRSAARGRAASADAMAREFGYKRGALYRVNWVSDQYSQYGTRVVSVAEREAIHTLEAILHTEPPIAEHTTDTHEATEYVFALFDLLGLRFNPRLSDAGDLLLHLLGAPSGLPVDVVMRSRARPPPVVGDPPDTTSSCSIMSLCRPISSSSTTYAHDLRAFWTFLDEQGLAWNRVGVMELAEFAAWARGPAQRRRHVRRGCAAVAADGEPDAHRSGRLL